MRAHVWIVTAAILGVARAHAAAPAAGEAGNSSGSPQDYQQFDLAGAWVPLITEDWIYRMNLAKPGEPGRSIPLNPEGQRRTKEWRGAPDAQGRLPCTNYGAPSILRMPGHMRISWEDPRTLKLDFSAGEQSRLFHFADNLPPQGFASTYPPETLGRSPAAPAQASLQGHSVATWHKQAGTVGLGASAFEDKGAERGGSLVVVTSRMTAGYLQANGVPYSDAAELTEYFKPFQFPDGSDGLVVTAVVEDSAYLTEPYVRSTHFRREPDNARWAPYSCIQE